MFPVYRQRDGYGHERRDRNDEVFDFCREKLVEGVAVNIFVEGEHHLDKRVLTMQKGIARIAFGTYEQHKLEDLQIIPVGCNYVAGDELRDEAKLIVGEPLFIKDYWDRYQLNPGATITALCADIKKALISICYNIDDKEDDVLVEQLLTLWRNDHPGVMVPVVETGNSRFLEEKAVIAKVNAMPATEKDVLKEKSTAYFSALGQEGISDEALSRPKQGNLIWIGFFILGLIPALAGYLLSWPIREFAQYITRTKVKKREFRTSIIMGVGTVGAFFYYIIMFIVGLFLGWPFLITLALMLPILTWFSIFWTERFRHWVAARNAKSHPRRQMLLDLRGKVTY